MINYITHDVSHYIKDIRYENSILFWYDNLIYCKVLHSYFDELYIPVRLDAGKIPCNVIDIRIINHRTLLILVLLITDTTGTKYIRYIRYYLTHEEVMQVRMEYNI